MTQNLTPVFGNVLDFFRGFFVEDGTELEVLHYDGDSEDPEADEWTIQATITKSWFAYSQQGDKGNSLVVLIFETESEETYDGLKSKDATHVAIGEQIFTVTSIPNAPISVLDAARYWQIECDPIGKKKPA